MIPPSRDWREFRKRIIIAARTRKPSTPQRIDAARAFALKCAHLASADHCRDVVVLDVRGLSPVCDFLVLATGTSARQMRTVAHEIGEIGAENGFPVYSVAGQEGENWIVADCIDVVVHVFSIEARQYYDLDNLWGDGKKVEA